MGRGFEDEEFSAASFQKARAKKVEEDQRAADAAAEADPELRAIREQTRQLQQDTVESSRSAVKTMKETIVVGERTQLKLNAQGEQLREVEASAQRANEQADLSYEHARDLHKYKGFIPISLKNVFTGAKKKSEDKELEKKNRRLDKELKRSEHAEGTAAPGAAGAVANMPAGEPRRRQYADDNEQEIDENLNELSIGLATLRGNATAMNKELDDQNVTMKRTDAYVEHTDYTINSANRKLKDFM